MTCAPQRHRFNVEEFNRLADAGLFDVEQRLELVDGEVYEMSAAKPPHASTVDRLNWHLTRKLPDGFGVRVQGPVVVGEESQPEPDYTVVRVPTDALGDRHPASEDILLVVEVAVTSYLHDHRTKRAVYAAHGIHDYWIVDVRKRRIEVFSEPVGEEYRHEWIATPGDVLRVPGTEVSVPVEDIVGV